MNEKLPHKTLQRQFQDPRKCYEKRPLFFEREHTKEHALKRTYI